MFINYYSAKCMLGKMAKNARYEGELFVWDVGKRKHFVILDDYILKKKDIKLISLLAPISFHYVSQENLNILKESFGSVSKVKLKSTITSIDKLEFAGKKNRRFRNYLNRYKDLIIKDDPNNLSDVAKMLNVWSETSGDKYFRDFSGKNLYFLTNNYHEKCDCVFIYDNDELVSFGVASPMNNGQCSYIIGKALCLKYPGLSEVTDIKLYEKLLNKHKSFSINLGQASKGLKFYKLKFPNTIMEDHYDGKVEI